MATPTANVTNRQSRADTLQAVLLTQLGCTMNGSLETYRDDLLAILQAGQLTALFQPIAGTGCIIGYEGLIRGPSNHFLHSPINLFQTAAECGLLAKLDQACSQTVIAAFASTHLAGQLFLNICPASLTDSEADPSWLINCLGRHGLPPQRIVIELTETQPIGDYSQLRQAVMYYRQQGFRIALDDLGEGFSSLRLWSELQPDFVKIDKYFIQGIAQDAQKRQFVRSIQHIAVGTGTRVIAEGIETHAELDVVEELGIGLMQGYLIGKPQGKPVANILPDPRRNSIAAAAPRQAGDLLCQTETVSLRTSNMEAWRFFASEPDLYALPVLDGDKPVGLLKRQTLLELFSRPYCQEIFGPRPCSSHMDHAPLIVEQSTSLLELSRLVTSSERRYLNDGFILTEQGNYLGMGSGRDLMRAMTELQIDAARHANPLTGLPGNVALQQSINRLLADARPFVAVYIDLDHFKPYNDLYGYARGDELLQYLGTLLQEVFEDEGNFIGHVGGDDFILLLRSRSWQQNCTTLISLFEQKKRPFFEPEHWVASGYRAQDRRGEWQWHPLVSLSLGAVPVLPGQFENHHAVASAAAHAKAMAKRQQGSALFVEQENEIRTAA